MPRLPKPAARISRPLLRPLPLGLIVFGLALLAGVVLLLRPAESAQAVVARGVVMSESGPVAGAVVRVQASADFTLTDDRGRFALALPEATLDAPLTAWAEGYYVGSAQPESLVETVAITLTPYYSTDNPAYDWFSHEGAAGSQSCSHCMPCYEEWRQDAHAQSALNPRFLSLYNGSDVSGQLGVPTVYRFDSALGVDVPVAPSLGQGDVGPGFRLDYPDLGGNCALCHAPLAAQPGAAYHADLRAVSGIAAEGVFCEFCHKVGAVTLAAQTGLPDPGRPGLLSLRLYRPYADQQVFFGNFDDVTRRVSYLPLFEQSQFCAPCHFGDFWGTTVYNSFGEWLDSPYSDPVTGQTCQDCHMPPVDYPYFVYPEQGGVIRDPALIRSHRMPGALDADLLQNTADLDVQAAEVDGALRVTVRVTNSGAGHHLPTDSPLRNVILLVSATDTSGAPLALLDGPTIPAWGGAGDPAQGYYAGQPGVLYAKVLADFYTGETPTYAYWRQTVVVSDNRLPALATDESRYTFALPEGGTATVHVSLWLRRAFIELMDLKGWDVPDMLLARRVEVVGG